MLDFLELSFVQNAIIASVLISIVCGVVGSLIVVNKMVFITGGIAHATYGGVGLAIYFSIPVMLTTSIFSVFVAILISICMFKLKHRLDIFIGFFWSFGMAVGVILLDLTPGYNVDLQSYLFGNILSVNEDDIYVMILLDIFILVSIATLYHKLLALSYDEEFAKLKGVNVAFLNIFLMIIIALSVVTAMRLVGMIMVISLMSVPVFIAERFCNSLNKMMFISSLISLFFSISGIAISYMLDISTGASIIAISSIFFLPFIYKRFANS